MASLQRSASSSDSDPQYANIDERKRKRMLSNRESARRSRMRKQKRLQDLVQEVSALQKDNSQISERISVATQCYIEMQSANNVLRAQAMELTERLRSLNSVLQVVEEVGGYAVDIPEIPEPWQLPVRYSQLWLRLICSSMMDRLFFLVLANG